MLAHIGEIVQRFIMIDGVLYVEVSLAYAAFALSYNCNMIALLTAAGGINEGNSDRHC